MTHPYYQIFRFKTKKNKHLFRPKLYRPSYKKIKDEALYDLVKKEILILKEESKKNWLKSNIKVEFFAEKFKVKIPQMKKIFKLLNQKGLLSQAHNVPPHDSKRYRYTFGRGDSSWSASTYNIR